MNRAGLIAIVDEKEPREGALPRRFTARASASRTANTSHHGQILAEWDPFTFSILTETAGSVKFDDLRPA